MKTKKLKYAMVGGAKGSFIGPIHRMAVRMDDLGDLVAGCFSRDAKANAAGEMARAGEYMFQVTNDDLGMCYKRLCDLIDALSGRM